MKYQKISIVALLGLLLLGACPKGENKEASKGTASEDPNTVVATYEGGTITAKELDDATKREVAELKKEAIDRILQNRWLGPKAKAAGKPVQAFMQEEVMKRVTEPSDAEIKAYYDQAKAQDPNVPPLNDAIKAQIAQGIKRQRFPMLVQEYMASVRNEAKLKVTLAPPRYDIKPSGTSKGPKDAPITLIAVSDYECPYCGKAEETIKEVLKAYPEKIKLVFNDFPLFFHKHAQKAAEAAHCAEDQGKYWEMHDKLFGNQKALEVEQLKGYAKDLGLDTVKFNTCLDSGIKAKMIQDSVVAGEAHGINSTPMFFLNGLLVEGAQPLSAFKEIIDRELAKK